MILADLLCAFLKVGFFAFGGAYGAIPLIRDVVLSYGWLSEERLSYWIAVSESTPGPIMVNLATCVGSQQAGIPGALVATAAVVLPSFVMILLVMGFFSAAFRNRRFQAVLSGLKPAVIGIVLVAGVSMTVHNCLRKEAGGADVKAMALSALLAAAFFFPILPHRRRISPIALIILSAFLGIAAYGS